MRPEVLETNFYAWRATGDVKFYNRAKSMVNSINTFLRTPTVAFAPIENVDATNSDFIDDMESFWFAETLKYLYLTFDDPNRWSLDKCKCVPTLLMERRPLTCYRLCFLCRRVQHRGAPVQTARKKVRRRRAAAHGWKSGAAEAAAAGEERWRRCEVKGWAWG